MTIRDSDSREHKVLRTGQIDSATAGQIHETCPHFQDIHDILESKQVGDDTRNMGAGLIQNRTRQPSFANWLEIYTCHRCAAHDGVLKTNVSLLNDGQKRGKQTSSSVLVLTLVTQSPGANKSTTAP